MEITLELIFWTIIVISTLLYLGIGALFGIHFEIGMEESKTIFDSLKSLLFERILFIIAWLPFVIIVYILKPKT